MAKNALALVRNRENSVNSFGLKRTLLCVLWISDDHYYGINAILWWEITTSTLWNRAHNVYISGHWLLCDQFHLHPSIMCLSVVCLLLFVLLFEINMRPNKIYSSINRIEEVAEVWAHAIENKHELNCKSVWRRRKKKINKKTHTCMYNVQRL